VCDLATAHRSALEVILSGGESKCINLGTGVGISVKEVISVCEKVAGMQVPVVVSSRRPGDPSSLVASNGYAKEVLGFFPKFDIHETIKTAWQWEKNRKY
jgi:UDP-glucose 4-epimerase